MTPQPYTLSALIQNQAQAQPQACALLAPDHLPLNYGRLYQHLCQTADLLRHLDIGPGDRVAILLPNGPEMATAFLTVAACTASAPLNPAYRAEELAFYLADLHAKALILPAGSNSPALAVADKLGIAIIELVPHDDAAGLFTLRPIHEATPVGSEVVGTNMTTIVAVNEDDIALILHTSGTTSRPKMVPLTQRNLCISALNVARSLQLAPTDRCLNVMPLFHIHGLVAALLAPLAAGGSVVCMPGFEAATFFGALAQFEPTWYTAVPTMHQAILGSAARHPNQKPRTPLRFIRSSSASLPPSVMASLETTFGAPVIEAYGMTEASHQMASNPLPPLLRKPGSVGLPAGPEIAIMAADGPELLPSGGSGEVVIRGENVTPGYLSLTVEAPAQAFGAGWFRTGDQGYFDADGYLFLSGRLKEIINRGGEKVIPREIDEVLLQHPGVAQAVAFAVPHPTLGEDVAAAVVLKPDGDASPEELRKLAFERLTDFKVPSQIIIVAEIPKGPTGKLQRIGLHEKLIEQIRPDYVAPRDEIEQAIAAMWKDVLDVVQVGAFDNFFILGGDSLSAARLVARINELFQVRLPLSAVFREPTVAGHADLLVAAFASSQTATAIDRRDGT